MRNFLLISYIIINVYQTKGGVFMNAKKYEEKLINLAKLKANDFYGDDLPEPVRQRLDDELKFISKHGLSAAYMFAYEAPTHLQKCITATTITDYTLVAFLLGLTEINPMPPHYLCTCCGYTEFPFGFDTEKTEWDIPHKHCPKCLENLHIHGYSIEMPSDANPNIFIEHASKYEKQEIIDFAKKFFNDFRLVYRIALSDFSPDRDEKTANNNEYEENIIYLLPNEDIKNQDFAPIKADLPVILGKKEDLSDYTYIHFNYFYHSLNYLTRKLEEHVWKVSLYRYLDDECTRSLFSSPKVLGTRDDVIDTGTLDIPFFMSKDIRSKLKGTKHKNFTDLLCAYENIVPQVKENDNKLHNSAHTCIVINALKLAFFKSNHPIEYYMEMLEFYKDQLTLEILEQTDEMLRKKIIYDNDRLSPILYEMRKRNIKLLRINKFRSKYYTFTEYRDNTCLHGILPPLYLMPKDKIGVWDDKGFLIETKYKNKGLFIINGKINEVIFINLENGYTIFKFFETNNNTILCKGYMPKLNIGDNYVLKGHLLEHEKYGQYFKVTEYDPL